MKRKKYIPTFIGSVETFEGESIEEKVQKLIENNEPITDGAPIIYTEKKDGVLPQYAQKIPLCWVHYRKDD